MKKPLPKKENTAFTVKVRQLAGLPWGKSDLRDKTSCLDNSGWKLLKEWAYEFPSPPNVTQIRTALTTPIESRSQPVVRLLRAKDFVSILNELDVHICANVHLWVRK